MTENCVRKIKRNKTAEEESLMFPCFQISSDVELKDIPTTGEEYLLKVINERNNCQTVTKCEVDLSKFARNQSQFVQEIPRLKAPETLRPTREWQNIQVADFSEVRLYISRLYEKSSQWPEIKKVHMILNAKVWKNFLESNEPTLSCILGINYKIFDSGLEYLIDSLDDIKHGDTIPYKSGQWIYAILACIRQPLLRESVSLLRDLARKCAEVRSHINPENENSIELTTPPNIFICLVARYFRQLDLAD